MQYVRRAAHVARIFARFGFAYALSSLGLGQYLPRARREGVGAAARGLSHPVRLRLALEEIGATGIKIGQAMASRPDLLPPEYVTELRKLQEEVPPFSSQEARAVVERELGGALEEFFCEFDPEPTAAASLSQVHRARRPDGRAVAVKVQRPEVRQQIELDLEILAFAAQAAQHYSEWCRDNDVVGWVREFSQILRTELDFSREAYHTDRLRQELQDSPGVTVPRVHWDLTTTRVLTLDFVEGVSPNDREQLEEWKLDLPLVARRFAESMFYQVMQSGFFHADPHAGNLRLQQDGTVAYLDFGHMDFAGSELRHQLTNLMQSFLESDSHGVMNVLTSVGSLSKRTELAALRLDVDKLVARFNPRGMGLFSLAEAMDELLGLLVKHSIRVSPTFAGLLRALVISESVCFELDPDFDQLSLAQQTISRRMRERLRPQHLLSQVQATGREWSHYLNRIPRQVSDLLLRMQAGGSRVRLELENVEQPLHRLDLMANRLSFAIVVAAFVMASAMIMASPQAMAAFGGTVAYSFGVLGGLTGLWLLYSILRSGRL